MPISDAFYDHRIDEPTSAEMSIMRVAYIDLANLVDGLLEQSRSKSLAMTHLEDSLMRAVQGLAIDRGEKVEVGL